MNSVNKKILAIVVVLLVAVGIYAGYRAFIVPKGEEGRKHVTVRVLISKENIDETFEYDTEHQYLYELLKEKENELGISFKMYDFGAMVTGMMNYTANEAENE